MEVLAPVTQHSEQANTVRNAATNQPVTPSGINEAVETGPIEINPDAPEDREGDIDRIESPTDRNGGAFRPVLTAGDAKQEVVLVKGGTSHEDSEPRYEVSRPDWDSSRMVAASALAVYTQMEI